MTTDSLYVKDLLDLFEQEAPLALQEDYDNAGLIVGSPDRMVQSAMVCLDLSEAIIEEAAGKGCHLIITHHPVIFKGLKRLGNRTEVERIIVSAIRHDICIMAMHTNLDNVYQGVNHMLAEKLGLKDLAVLRPAEGSLCKLVTFCPIDHAQVVRSAMFDAGAGHIGNYDSCSFNAQGSGTFRAQADAKPFVGTIGEVHSEPEVRIETILPLHLAGSVVSAMKRAHPYEEVAYDLYPLLNGHQRVGSGMVGVLEKSMSAHAFLEHVQAVLGTPVLRHTDAYGKFIKRVAICGGSGAFLLPDARRSGADAFVTSDLKYHDFFDAGLLLIDGGHYETEQFTTQLMANMIKKKFPTFAVLFPEQDYRVIQYYIKPQ
ncbi:MAG TPA: Nif3-like dinuclear metal center hexameric protein [Bacteroidales bacterium]|nr:Nif3-like dinuclear metal center hexameric protein [Bacteroidales bacterium]